MVPAGEVVSQFVREENREQSNRERQSGKKQRRMMIRSREGSEQSIEGSRLIVGVSGGKVRAGDQRGEHRNKKQPNSQDQRTQWRVRGSGAVEDPSILAWRPNRRLRDVSGNALFGFRRIHKTLLCSRCGGVFQALQFFAWLEANRFAGRDADFFAGARIAANAGFTGFDAEHPELAQFDALAAAESVFQGFKDGLDGLLRLGTADIGFGNYSIYDIELDHTTLQESVARC